MGMSKGSECYVKIYENKRHSPWSSCKEKGAGQVFKNGLTVFIMTTDYIHSSSPLLQDQTWSGWARTRDSECLWHPAEHPVLDPSNSFSPSPHLAHSPTLHSSHLPSKIECSLLSLQLLPKSNFYFTTVCNHTACIIQHSVLAVIKRQPSIFLLRCE